VSACEPEIDSLVVVEIICAIEEILGVSLPPTFSPRGGYDDVEACVADLLDVARTVWIEITKENEYHD
jgi:acyl carrier protein